MKDRIKKIRKELDLTQQEFADRIGIKRGGVANYEIGRNIPIDSVISLICREFNVNEQWLRDGTGEMFIEQTRDEQIASFVGSIQASADDSFKKRFISMLSALDESEWEVLEKMTLMLHDKMD
ncbi:helix-turn-helix domain-containing protein [Acetatifactor aquisgranensis]|uniref:helix-turn-helix domain-containing protein n=1 Tax=Acetatifactor aquisgranensis TaxID=2941233 RepID=UPI0020404C2A|nr:helix-turn-helix transcriptional regulator [Acetatifactor aquisgranensis]